MPGNYVDHLLNMAPGGLNLIVESEMFNRQFGLNKSIIARYLDFLADILRGNWGISFAYARPVLLLISEKLVWTLVLLLPAKFLSMVLGVCLGAYSGWHLDKKRDFILLNIMVFMNAIPSYILAVIFIFIFGYYLNIFPLTGFVSIEALTHGIRIEDVSYHAILPLITLTISGIPNNYYLVRNTVTLSVREDYITTARAMGVGEKRLIFRHCLPNALLPVVTLVPIQIAHLMMGSVLVESVFSWPGIGLLTFEAVSSRDLPILQGVFLVFTVLVIFGNMIADLFYSFIDPRVKKNV
jgi:peptide/nickel transport system permease protein